MTNRLLVLCSHEPTLDPRIDWAAHFSADDGYDVCVAGWTENNPEPKFKDSKKFKTFRSDRQSNTIGQKAVKKMMREHKVLSPLKTPLYSLYAAIVFFLFVIYRVLLAPWVVLDFLLEKVHISKYTTRQIEHIAEIVRRRVFYTADKISGGKLSYLAESYEGYKWYLQTHSMGAAGALLQRIEDEEWVPDVIHANDPDAMLAAVLVKKKYNCRLVYDAHEYGPDAYLLRPKPRGVFFWFERQMLQHFDAALTVTPQLAKKFQARYKNKPYFHVVPNATPKPKTIPRIADEIIAKHGKGKVKFLYHGGFAPHRGIEEIITGFKSIDEKKAVLFVRGPENPFKATLVEHAKMEGLLNKSVFFLDSIAEQHLVSSAKLVDVGIIPYLSHIENHAGACPNKLSQYMHAGLAILSVDLQFVASVVTAADCGLVYNDREEGDFTRQVKKLITNKEARRKYAKSGKEYGYSTYNYQAYYTILKALYKNQKPPTGIPHTT